MLQKWGRELAKWMRAQGSGDGDCLIDGEMLSLGGVCEGIVSKDSLRDEL